MRKKLIENDIITLFAVPESLVTRDEEEAIIYSVSVELGKCPFFSTCNSLKGITTHFSVYKTDVVTRKHCFPDWAADKTFLKLTKVGRVALDYQLWPMQTQRKHESNNIMASNLQ